MEALAAEAEREVAARRQRSIDEAAEIQRALELVNCSDFELDSTTEQADTHAKFPLSILPSDFLDHSIH